MPIFNNYDYEPLRAEDEARFIVLEPAKDNIDHLSYSIFQYRRSAKGFEYSAVSYSWGDKPQFSQNL
ncbi:hypothetical protein HD806DRAFT_497380 [Xylariaceae sp. AK1471]|nr:hypothetical protein HD806DRAFT_497380 [Xylariaceae sp. AK1471]